MSVSLNNSKDIVASSIGIIKGNKTIDVVEAISAVQGLAPETLNSLEKVATAIDNNPQFFQTVASGLAAKADKSELTAAVNTINTSINAKQNKFIIAEIPANTGRLFDNNSTKFRAINVTTPLSITATRDDYLTISSDTYDKANIDGKITTINNALDTKATTTALNNKQDKIVLGTSSTGSQSWINTTTSKLKNIVGANLTLSADDDKLTITGIDACDKTNIDTK